jgi:hypothetical protein
MEPELGKTYIVKSHSGYVPATFVAHIHRDGYTSKYGTFRTNATNHYLFHNLKTGRDIEIKSRVKIRRLVDEERS